LHHAFDLFAQSSDYEGTPNAVLEAMALETPIVATSAGASDGSAHDRIVGRVVRPGDVPGLTAAIREALAHRDATAARVRSARARVENELSFEPRMRPVEGTYAHLI